MEIEKIKTISLCTTIIEVVLTIATWVMIIFCFSFSGVAGSLVGDSLDYATDVDPNSVVAGYQVIGGLAGAALGAIGWLALMVLVIVAGFYSLVMIASIVVGIIALRKRTSVKMFKADSITKIVICILPALSVFGQKIHSISDFVIIFIGLVFCIITGLSIYNITRLNKLQ